MACELVIRQGVAIHNEVGLIALDEHIRLADGKGLVVDLLPERHKLGGSVELAQIFFRNREHTPGAAGGIIDRPCHVFPRENVAVIAE